MLNSSDWIELPSILARNGVRYLVIGGYAVMKYAEPRYTKDLDLWVSVDKANAMAVYQSLKEFGAPLEGLTEADFAQEGYFYQMGRPPMRIGVLMSVPGANFEEAWARRNEVELANLQIPFASKADLISMKLASGRPQDLLDVENLRQSEE